MEGPSESSLQTSWPGTHLLHVRCKTRRPSRSCPIDLSSDATLLLPDSDCTSETSRRHPSHSSARGQVFISKQKERSNAEDSKETRIRVQPSTKDHSSYGTQQNTIGHSEYRGFITASRVVSHAGYRVRTGCGHGKCQVPHAIRQDITQQLTSFAYAWKSRAWRRSGTVVTTGLYSVFV